MIVVSGFAAWGICATAIGLLNLLLIPHFYRDDRFAGWKPTVTFVSKVLVVLGGCLLAIAVVTSR